MKKRSYQLNNKRYNLLNYKIKNNIGIGNFTKIYNFTNLHKSNI